MKKLLILMLVIAMALMAFMGCSASSNVKDSPSSSAPADDSPVTSAPADNAPEAADGDEIVIGVTLMDYNFTFFQDMLAMMKKTAERLGIRLADIDGQGDVQKQLQGVEDLIAAGEIDALILNPVDSAAIASGTLAANDAGIPVITVDVRSQSGDVLAHVASNNLDIGREAGKYTLELLKKRNGDYKGNVLLIEYPQITSIADRGNGFLEIMEQYPEIQVVKQAPTNLNVAESQALMENLLQTYPAGSLDVVYGSNSTNSLGIIAAAEAAGRNDFDIVCVDDDPTILAALEKNSSTAATIVQSPTEMGRISVELAVKAAKGEKIEESEVATELKVVTRDNIKEFLASYEAMQAELEPYKTK